jgi:hypothetical protein
MMAAMVFTTTKKPGIRANRAVWKWQEELAKQTNLTFITPQ